VKSLCVYLEVSRSGYYKWLERKGILNRYESDRETLKVFILQKWNRHKTNGYRNLAQQIRNETGWIFSDLLCHKVCKNLGIRSQARKSKYARPGQEHINFKNIIDSNWTTTRPFEKIVTDTTILSNKYGKKELTMYIDVFNNEVISHCISDDRHGSNIKGHMTALKQFLQEKTKRGYAAEETILHSDQGIAYTSRAFYNAHKDYNIIRSMSRVGTPTDNPKIESINGWMKADLYIDYQLYISKDINKTVHDYIDYFNNERLACSLQYKTPVQVKLELGFN
jgi:transposase InsO family protein